MINLNTLKAGDRIKIRSNGKNDKGKLVQVGHDFIEYEKNNKVKIFIKFNKIEDISKTT